MYPFGYMALAGLGGCGLLWSIDAASRRRWVRAACGVVVAGCLLGEVTVRYQAARRQAKQVEQAPPAHEPTPS